MKKDYFHKKLNSKMDDLGYRTADLARMLKGKLNANAIYIARREKEYTHYAIRVICKVLKMDLGEMMANDIIFKEYYEAHKLIAKYKEGLK